MPALTKPDQDFLRQFEPDLLWQQHARKIIWGAIGIVGLGVFAYVWQRQAAEQEESAATRLAQARDVPALQQIVQDYPGKNVAAAALLQLADMHFQAGSYAEATNAYQRFLALFPRHPLADAASYGLAAVLEAQGNVEAAKTQYLQFVASRPNSYAAIGAKMGAARCAELLGQAKEARQTYEELVPATAGSAWQSEAFMRWTILGREAAKGSAGTTQQEAQVPLTLTFPVPAQGTPKP